MLTTVCVLSALARRFPRPWARNLSTRDDASPSSTTPNEDKFKFDPHLWSTSTSFNADEVDKFRAMAQSWWDPQGPCQPLHSMNTLRVSLVRQGLLQTGLIPEDQAQTGRDLTGLRILDVGCGGGLLSEPLARLGATVTGLDAAEENIRIAQEHAHQDEAIRERLTYEACTAEDFCQRNPEVQFDAVVASEVIEHVDQQPLFVHTCSQLVRERGSLFFTTLNRTQESYLAGIVAAEYVLRLLPRGTHDWQKFVQPEELEGWLNAAGCRTRSVQGMVYMPVFNTWHWIPVNRVNYALHAVKEPALTSFID
ncbi:hypothetical protein TCAL_07962 [Tigriopus californicus]|uniref:Ubiquinone biosynthesis O-methyltransferase, mitochondrial n=1 Tax=Tigriopus californicus TaxID=6832 RepID=A0A553NBI0_TIGCA|nr:ubiquinone biosynthesis O-methyltransferase, mitochondrial-like [Tigriopus californicus]TRY62804.1 hypothetical protein TCAL_07962 [Tigriopus californicus]|eukprot:TCALIF_07962-PA protein Name:"Similar to Coq3 Hexaprenyldihydroxybenzoate methyltransferase, mitochondrial (Rattus norvegicus)" AED:0.05 eAED:0.05 QI:0/-1/0/1/-1/1/1/0/308